MRLCLLNKLFVFTAHSSSRELILVVLYLIRKFMFIYFYICVLCNLHKVCISLVLRQSLDLFFISNVDLDVQIINLLLKEVSEEYFCKDLYYKVYVQARFSVRFIAFQKQNRSQTASDIFKFGKHKISNNKIARTNALKKENKVKPMELLVLVSSKDCSSSTPNLSTWSSSRTLMGKISFKASFPLRCFQRLSVPCLATQRCGWHHNWHTSGTSTPVLSY